MTSDTAYARAAILPTKRHDVVFHELDGEAVLFDRTSGAVHRFNATTLAVWNACDGSRSASAIARIITARYALESDNARTEVDNVIRSLTNKGLLLKAPGAGCLQRDVRSEENPPAQDPSQAPSDCAEESRSTSRLPSRRELLCGGTAKLIYTAPLISTFFASGACASGPSASGAFGTDGFGDCKSLGYSCTTNPDCCEEASDKTACRDIGGPTTQCCVKSGKGGCTLDGHCCDYPADTCNAGTCN